MPSSSAVIAKRRRTRPALDAAACDPRGALAQAEAFLWSQQRDDGLWCSAVFAGPMLTALYVIFKHGVGGADASAVSSARSASQGRDGNVAERFNAYLLKKQRRDGAWSAQGGLVCGHGIGASGPGISPADDLSCSATVYLALRLGGVPADDPALLAAQAFILAGGGLARLDPTVRGLFAMFGLVPRDTAPHVPVERTLLPNVPVPEPLRDAWLAWSIISFHQPVIALPNGRHRANPWLDGLWLPRQPRLPGELPRPTSKPGAWLRAVALRRATTTLLQRQSAAGLWPGGALPTMVSLAALALEGFDARSEPGRRGLAALQQLLWEEGGTLQLQPSRTQVSDTAAGLVALGARKSAAAARAVDALLDRQVPDANVAGLMRRSRSEREDSVDGNNDANCPWRVRWSRRLLEVWQPWLMHRRHRLRMRESERSAAGWAASAQADIPEVLATADVILAACGQDAGSSVAMPVRQGVWWLLAAQSRTGHWGNGGGSPHMTARALEALALWKRCVPLSASHADPALAHLRRHTRAACRRAVRWLRATQDAHGSWSEGGGGPRLQPTGQGLRALHTACVVRGDTMVEAALRWLRDNQNADGGWSETTRDGSRRRLPGEQRSASGATARALLGMLAYLPPHDPAIERAVAYLVQRQVGPARARPRDVDGTLPLPRGKTWRDEAIASSETRVRGSATGAPSSHVSPSNLASPSAASSSVSTPSAASPSDASAMGPHASRLLQHSAPMHALAMYVAACDAHG